MERVKAAVRTFCLVYEGKFSEHQVSDGRDEIGGGKHSDPNSLQFSPDKWLYLFLFLVVHRFVSWLNTSGGPHLSFCPIATYEYKFSDP